MKSAWVNIYEVSFRDAYEEAFGVRPVFNVDHLTDAELLARTYNIRRRPRSSSVGRNG